MRLALEELGLPYETVLVDRRKAGHKAKAYLALNPNGLIPVLETPHGPMFETGAILLWLAEETGALMPRPGSLERQHALQWLVWLSNTLHASERMLFYPEQYTDGDREALRQKVRTRIIAHLDILAAAQTTPWLDQDAPSIHACYLAPMLRWAALYGGDTRWFALSRWPRLLAFAKRAEARPASQRVARAEGLGAKPFSEPTPCNPPEGSAL